MTLETSLALFLLCLVGSAVSSGSETALVSASRLRLEPIRSEGRRAAALALGLLEQRDRTLAVTLIATNAFNIAAGAVATVVFQDFFGAAGSIVATVTVTVLLLVFSEITPKAYFRHHAEPMLMHTAAAWRVLSVLLVPLTYPTGLFSSFLYRILGRQPRSVFVSREEIRLVLGDSVEGGAIRDHEHEMLESALGYSETIAREVMVPMADVALIAESARTEDVLELVGTRGYTRIPVFRDRVDQIVGLINVFDILYAEKRRTFARAYVRPARLVPDTKPIDELFLEMQRERESLVVAVNEFGACIGVVSTEDIIEEIFGELSDEHEDATPEIRRIGPGQYRVSGLSDIDDLNAEAGWEIPKATYTTVGGYVLFRLGRIPHPGEWFVEGDLRVRVVDADRYSVRLVEITDTQATGEAGD